MVQLILTPVVDYLNIIYSNKMSNLLQSLFLRILKYYAAKFTFFFSKQTNKKKKKIDLPTTRKAAMTRKLFIYHFPIAKQNEIYAKSIFRDF